MKIIIEDKYDWITKKPDRWLHFIRADNKVIKVKANTHSPDVDKDHGLYVLSELEYLHPSDQQIITNTVQNPKENCFMFSEFGNDMFDEARFQAFFCKLLNKKRK